jgi:hypothetical protein
MTKFKWRNPNSKYSAHGSHLIGTLRVYHQGGLDNYCGLYSVLNLVNFLYLTKDLQYVEEPAVAQRLGDFIGTENFWAFIGLVQAGAFNSAFPETPLGDEGLDASELKDTLDQALSYFKISAQVKVEEDESIYAGDPSQYSRWFRIGAEGPFIAPNSPDDALGVACVREDEDDELEHWVVLVGSNHLEDTGIECPEWDGIVLDSDRGYKFWRIDPEQIQLHIQREKTQQDVAIYWISSFVSVTVN